MSWGGKPFTAQYDGQCVECEGHIVAGDLIELVPAGNGYRHSPDCPPTIEDRSDAAAKRTPRCGYCGLNHPGEC